jgi:hypothetical protein
MPFRTRKAETVTVPVEPPSGVLAWGAAALAGTLAGLAFLALEMAVGKAAIGQEQGLAAHMALMGGLAQDGAPSVIAVIVVFLLPLVLALACGALVALVAVRRSSALAAWWAGAISGLVVYSVNVSYLLAPALHWIGELRDRVSVLSPWYSASSLW